MAAADAALHLQPLPILWALQTPEADSATHRRYAAFHESGHIFTAHRSHLTPEVASTTDDGPTFLGHNRETTIRIAATGFLVQALLIDADYKRVNHGIPPEDPDVLDEDPDSYDPHDLRVLVRTVMRTTHPCRRGGDHIASEYLDDPRWLFRQLTPTLKDWSNIEALAHGLMTTGQLDRARISQLMSTRPL